MEIIAVSESSAFPVAFTIVLPLQAAAHRCAWEHSVGVSSQGKLIVPPFVRVTSMGVRLGESRMTFGLGSASKQTEIE